MSHIQMVDTKMRERTIVGSHSEIIPIGNFSSLALQMLLHSLIVILNSQYSSVTKIWPREFIWVHEMSAIGECRETYSCLSMPEASNNLC
jgi:hypothetical protein